MGMKEVLKRNAIEKILILFSKLSGSVRSKYMILLFFSVLVAGLELLVITAVAFLLNPSIIDELPRYLGSYLNVSHLLDLRLVIFAIFILCVVRIFLAFYTARVNAAIGHSLSLSIYKNVFSWDYQSFENENKNEIIADLMVKINQTVGRIIRPLTQLSISMIIITVILPVMIAQNPSEVLSLCILSLLIYVTFSLVIKSKRRQFSFIISKNTNGISQHLRESLDAFILIKKQNLFQYFNTKYRAIDKELRDASDFSLALGIVPKYLLEFVAMSLILGYSAMSDNGILDYSFLIVALFRIAPLFQQVFLSLHSFRTFAHVLDDILERLGVTNSQFSNNVSNNNFAIALDENVENGKSFIKIDKSKFQRSSDDFIYFPEVTIKLGGLNLLKGASGSGKTTYFNCLLSLYSFFKPPAVNLFLESRWEKQVDNFWADNSFYVSQESILFESSLQENLLVDDSFIADDELNSILTGTGVTEFLTLDSKILENGKNLSGGQKQRICLARALASKKSFIFIDEGINAIDVKAQKKVLDYILQYRPSLTIFMICHGDQFDDIADFINTI